jgi:hypothetical protein
MMEKEPSSPSLVPLSERERNISLHVLEIKAVMTEIAQEK